MRPRVRWFLGFAVLPLAGPAAAGEATVHALTAGRAIAVEGPTSWIDGGFGRLGEGGHGDDFAARGRAEAHAGLDWEMTPTLLLRLHATARTEPGAAGGWRGGLVEAFVQYRPELRPDLALQWKAGLFFPPTSLENVDPLWQSPYTLTLSALNSWIGEEVRLGGLDAAIVHGRVGAGRLELGGAVFGGNDTSGALLAWRGWAFGPRLAVAGEVLPLPPLPTLEPGGRFERQRDDGTRPVDELDGRLGWHVRARWTRPGRARLQASWTDNRGDRALYRGQYAWATRYAQAGAQLDAGSFRLIAEGIVGDTGMGPAGQGVDVRFRAAYALLTWAGAAGRLRVSARYDWFRNDDRDGLPEPNDEHGDGGTIAVFYAPRPWLRLGVEYFDLRSNRPAAQYSGADESTDARRAQAEVRFAF